MVILLLAAVAYIVKQAKTSIELQCINMKYAWRRHRRERRAGYEIPRPPRRTSSLRRHRPEPEIRSVSHEVQLYDEVDLGESGFSIPDASLEWDSETETTEF